jgi:nucleoid DNA-binding protein
MNRNDVYKYVARRIDGCTKADVATVLDVYADFVKETLQKNVDETVMLPGIGKFSVKKIPAKSGISNLTKEPWERPARNELKFVVNKDVKQL